MSRASSLLEIRETTLFYCLYSHSLAFARFIRSEITRPDFTPPCAILVVTSQLLVRSFVLKETLFYKSVRRVHRLFVFLPLNAFGWQK
ncbi:hypothetical protein FNL49_06160 [Klebsiella michiganensis]|nr:hypothetical protein [Klebsiella michiganensis]TRW37974.1 hypothetical protein FNL49_06160 [Klebsiella michiganensis]